MLAGLGMAGGALLGSKLFGRKKQNVNPADAAMPYLEKIPETLKPYYEPYINAGLGSLQNLMPQYNALISDPNAVLNKFGAGYKESPGYQWNVDQATKAANRAAAAGGMVGSPLEQQELASQVSGMASQDYNNYLNNVLGLYGQGLGGLGGITQMGYGASNELAQSLANNLMSQAQLGYAGRANQNQMRQGMFGAGLGFLGSLLGPNPMASMGGSLMPNLY